MLSTRERNQSTQGISKIIAQANRTINHITVVHSG
jgi:hypothetical protein